MALPGAFDRQRQKETLYALLDLKATGVTVTMTAVTSQCQLPYSRPRAPLPVGNAEKVEKLLQEIGKKGNDFSTVN